jgi:hypothetical protein
MKLLDTSGGNTKLAKNNRDIKIRVAGLSLLPNDYLCPMRHAAECAAPCLKASGRGIMSNVISGRQAKTDFFTNDRAGFIAQLKKELANFERLCIKNGVVPYVRLNVLSDVQWELPAYGEIPQSFPGIRFYDYTKIAKRLGNTPDNYQLMFSYSRASAYQKQVEIAFQSNVPISVVFHGPMPSEYMGRTVVNGDNSDIENLKHAGNIIGLKYKPARGEDVDPADSVFIVDTNKIELREIERKRLLMENRG